MQRICQISTSKNVRKRRRVETYLLGLRVGKNLNNMLAKFFLHLLL